MPKTTVINVRKNELKKQDYDDFEHWNNEPRSLYIGRNMERYVKGTKKSIWHNPFRGQEACRKFEKHIRSNPQLWDRLEELEGKELGCWCNPKPCHGHILVKLLTEKLAKQTTSEQTAEKAWNIGQRVEKSREIDGAR